MNDNITPQAIDLEEAVLGAILIENTAASIVSQILPLDAFYNPNHKKIYECVIELNRDSEPVELLSVTNKLKSKNYLDDSLNPYVLTQLTNRIASAANIEYHSRIILQKYIQRRIIKLCQSKLSEAYLDSTDPLELLSVIAGELNSIMQLTESSNSSKFSELVSKVIKNAINFKDKEVVSGVPIEFLPLRERFGAWQPSDFIILAARPAMGKTSLALHFATHPSLKNGENVLLFSLEMSELQLTTRIVAQELGIPANRLTRDAHTHLNVDKLNQKLKDHNYIYSDNLIIDDRAGLDINQLVAKAKTLHLKSPLSLIVIDYLQLLKDESVKTSRGNREQEISSISRKLKILAKDLNIPVIALAQLSRAVESRGGDRSPQLSDLRESGSLEQDADIVMFINRPEYYGLIEDENGASTAGIAKIITAKHRNGSVGDDVLKWDAHLTRFSDNKESYEEKFQEISPNNNFDDEPF